MHIKSATIRNYRIHANTTVEFDRRLTLITGLNESGKSTLAEAIHRGLFFKAGAGGRDAKKMGSMNGGTPEVSLTLEIGGQEVRVRKVFRTGRGDCKIEESTGSTLNGEAAEQRLSELLQVGEQIGGAGAERKLDARWSHLWVWQGKGLSAELPTASVAEQQAELERRLQEQGGAALVLSDLDNRVEKKIREKRDELYTATDQPRSGSELAKATAAVEQARNRVAQAESAVGKLEQAVRDVTAARAEEERLTRVLVEIEKDLADVEQRTEQARVLDGKLSPIRHSLEETMRRIQELESAEKDLARARRELIEAEQALQPAQLAAREAENRRAAAEETARAAQEELEKAQTTREQASAWLEALRKHGEAMEAGARLLEKKRAQAEALKKHAELKGIEEQIARQPKIKPQDITALQKLSTEMTAAEAELGALAVRIELIQSRAPVTVNGAPLRPREALSIVEETEVRMGDDSVLRIRPGGEAGIAGAREKVGEAKRQWEKKLMALGVRDLDHAQKALEELRVNRDTEARRQEELKHLDPDGDLDQQVRELEGEEAELSRLASHAAGELRRELPAERAGVRSAHKKAETEAQEAEASMRSAQKAARAAQTAREERAAEEQVARKEEEKRRMESNGAAVRVQTLEQRSGESDARAARRLELDAARESQTSQLTILQRQLDELQPGQLELSAKRLRDALTVNRSAHQSKREQRVAAAQILRLDGTSDPQGDLEEAREVLRAAEAVRRDAAARGAAILRLAVLVDGVKRAQADKLAQPLREKARAYLESLYGTGADIVLEWGLGQRDDDGPVSGIRILRDRVGLGSFEFETLSGGTREQVGIALRFAMAEVLAENHDGTLPVVLDDAFANSDPERIGKLQDMIYLAAERGLQVIVLSCAPQDYSRLGAKEIRLERPVLRETAPTEPREDLQPVAETERRPATATAPPPPESERGTILLARLREMGGSAGNQSLREALDWDEASYTAAKEGLLAIGQVLAGRGRGGSLRLPGAGEG